jgi:hypothetical protein
MTRPLWLAAAAAGALGLVLALGSESVSSSEPAQTPASAEQSESRTQADVERLRASLARTERRIAQLETERPNQAAPPPDGANEEPADRNARPAAFTNEERRTHVAQAFEAERPDPSWRGESDARSLLRQVLPAGSALQSVECRHSLCRAETSHPSAEAQQAYVNTLAMPNAEHEMRFAGMLFDEGGERDGRDGSLRSVTYLVRAGYPLPSP